VTLVGGMPAPRDTAVVVTATAVLHSHGDGAHGRGIPVHEPPLVVPPATPGRYCSRGRGVQDAFSVVRGAYAGCRPGPAIQLRRSPRQWPLTGRFHGDTDRQLLAGSSPSTSIFQGQATGMELLLDSCSSTSGRDPDQPFGHHRSRPSMLEFVGTRTVVRERRGRPI
jgi:hypothetical protein